MGRFDVHLRDPAHGHEADDRHDSEGPKGDSEGGKRCRGYRSRTGASQAACKLGAGRNGPKSCHSLSLRSLGYLSLLMEHHFRRSHIYITTTTKDTFLATGLLGGQVPPTCDAPCLSITATISKYAGHILPRGLCPCLSLAQVEFISGGQLCVRLLFLTAFWPTVALMAARCCLCLFLISYSFLTAAATLNHGAGL